MIEMAEKTLELIFSSSWSVDRFREEQTIAKRFHRTFFRPAGI